MVHGTTKLRIPLVPKSGTTLNGGLVPRNKQRVVGKGEGHIWSLETPPKTLESSSVYIHNIW